MLLINFGILFVLKYLPVLAKPIGELISYMRPDFEMPVFQFLLPLGISFYTFQAMGYLIDLYRDKFKPEENLAKFALFLSFFPQIIQDQSAGMMNWQSSYMRPINLTIDG